MSLNCQTTSESKSLSGAEILFYSNYSNFITKNLHPLSEENLCGDEKGNEHSIELPQRERKSKRTHTDMMVDITIPSHVLLRSLSKDEQIGICRFKILTDLFCSKTRGFTSAEHTKKGWAEILRIKQLCLWTYTKAFVLKLN